MNEYVVPTGFFIGLGTCVWFAVRLINSWLGGGVKHKQKLAKFDEVTIARRNGENRLYENIDPAGAEDGQH
jgi:hypothetical protein